MKNVTKISIAVGSLAILGVAIYSILHIPKNPTIDSLRVQAQEARQREERARIDREIGEDTLSKALYDSCYNTATTSSGVRFDNQVRVAYECWKSESAKINTSGTVASAISEAPPKGKSIAQNTSSVQNVSHIEPEKPTITKGTVVLNVKPNKPKQSSESNYWTAYEIAISQIHKWEGLRLSAYWDHSGYSIGYGSRANSPTEKITRAEADRRLAVLAKQLLTKVQKDFPTLRPEAQGALVSFAYNCHKGYESVRKNGLQYHGQWCKTASGKIYDGLVKRRAEESRLIFSK